MDAAETPRPAPPDDTLSALLLSFQTASNANDLLRLTLVELARTFGAESGSVRIGHPDAGSPVTERPIHD